MGLREYLYTDRRTRREMAELKDLYARLCQHRTQAEEVCQHLCSRVVLEETLRSPEGLPKLIEEAAWRLCGELLVSEKHFPLVEIDLTRTRLSLGEIYELMHIVRHQLDFFEHPQKQQEIEKILTRFLSYLLDGQLPNLPTGDEITLYVPLYTMQADPAQAIDGIFRATIHSPEKDGIFDGLGEMLINNGLLASGIDPHMSESNKPLMLPSEAKHKSPAELIEAYLAGTPFKKFLHTPLPFSIPLRSRFEHMHVVGGSGHGKTQLLQHFILSDLAKVSAGEGSIIVIDSQGDMLNHILRLGCVAEMGERVIVIEPNDIEYPPALNLFDFGLDRLTDYKAVEREKLINGAIALYEYVFGALLGAELSQRQGVIFRYLARLMMVVPHATIHTLMDFMYEPESVRPYLPKLDPVSRRFFETQFFSKSFNDTRQQILTRMWGVLSNSVLERMFANERNKLNLFAAMNRGSLILINTAKDLLKQEGCEILGRFFIALICQAAQERAAIPENQRTPTFVYIDEAHDYFDESMENLLNQARKYSIGMVIAHQNLDQFEQKLRATVMASTSIKMVGGLSAKDAGAFAKEMRCEPEFLQSVRKHEKHTEFACTVRNYNPRPLCVSVALGEMERQPRSNAAARVALLTQNQSRYCADKKNGSEPETSKDDDSPLDEPELL